MIVPGGQEGYASRLFPDGVGKKLSPVIADVLLEDWGGPRSSLAVQHFQEKVIPDILYCLQANLTLVENPTFIAIFADKFSSQFGYPQAYAGQLARDVLKAVRANLPEELQVQPDLHPWSPWEKVFRLFSLGMINPVIAGRTGYSEDYIQLLRKKYMDITRIGGASPGGYPHWEAESELCRFIADFRQRFSADQFYLQKLEARQIVEDLGLKLDHLTLLDLLVNCSRVEGQLGVRELAKLLTGGKVSPKSAGRASPKLQLIPEFLGMSQGLALKGYAPKKVEEILLTLVKGGVLEVSGPEDLVSLTTKSASIAGRLVAPELARTLLAIQNSPDGDCDQACKMLTRFNREMLIAVLEEISAQGITPLGRTLCLLYPRVNKQLGLKIIKTLASLNSREGVPLLLDCLTHNDSLVRATAYQALGEISDKSTAFALLKGLHDPVPMVKEKAIEAVGKLGITAVTGHLQQIAANHKETPAVRRMAGKVAGEMIHKQR